ncbi:MAG: transglutaminase family protein [Sandaracinus sp.]|nr:transglutaminase family protein [Sandaracinus sp.]
MGAARAWRDDRDASRRLHVVERARHRARQAANARHGTTPSTPPPPEPVGGRVQAASEQSRLLGVPRAKTRDRDHLRDGRILTVEHETIYRYDEAVELSTHVFRLHPVHDLGQDVLDYRLEISPPGAARRAEDVFGNQILQYKIERPYQELWIRARSRLRVRPADAIAPLKRATLPLVWMPWQRQMMTPYLLPPELPETQLQELSEYAMSFALRNDFDLVETLRDMNHSIYRDFAYQPGATMLETSPFVVYAERRGVCQDFANLFICLCRLLNVPARYRVGYIYTGADYANQIQSEASHAWAEVYLPNVGWRGYDPTNGIMGGLDHVRVAHGRNYRDATPTSGTLFRGGGGERLERRCAARSRSIRRPKARFVAVERRPRLESARRIAPTRRRDPRTETRRALGMAAVTLERRSGAGPFQSPIAWPSSADASPLRLRRGLPRAPRPRGRTLLRDAAPRRAHAPPRRPQGLSRARARRRDGRRGRRVDSAVAVDGVGLAPRVGARVGRRSRGARGALGVGGSRRRGRRGSRRSPTRRAQQRDDLPSPHHAHPARRRSGGETPRARRRGAAPRGMARSLPGRRGPAELR